MYQWIPITPFPRSLKWFMSLRLSYLVSFSCFRSIQTAVIFCLFVVLMWIYPHGEVIYHTMYLPLGSKILLPIFLCLCSFDEGLFHWNEGDSPELCRWSFHPWWHAWIYCKWGWYFCLCKIFNIFLFLPLYIIPEAEVAPWFFILTNKVHCCLIHIFSAVISEILFWWTCAYDPVCFILWVYILLVLPYWGLLCYPLKHNLRVWIPFKVLFFPGVGAGIPWMVFLNLPPP